VTAERGVPEDPVLVLAHALVADVAVTLSTPVLVIKGIGAAHHGLRGPRRSADVDVLLEDDDAARAFGAELARRGWRRRPADADEFTFPRHSDTWYHPAWSCDIDVHHRFPGLDDDPRAAFAALWGSRVLLERAGRTVAVPGRTETLLLLALHALRSPWVDRHAAELRSLEEHARRLDLTELLALARALGATAPLRPFLEAAHGPSDIAWGQPSAEWRLRTALPDPQARRMVAFRRASWRGRLALVRLAVAPPRETLLKDRLHSSDAPLALVAALLRRWVRGLGAVPGAARRSRALLDDPTTPAA
jgi:hypothetical protein